MKMSRYNLLRYAKFLSVMLAAALFFSSCYTYRKTGLLQEHNRSLPVYAKEDYQDYRINVNDELLFRLITSDQTISKLILDNQTGYSQNIISYRVFSDGTIDLPFVKRIPVSGMTLSEATRIVENRFRQIIPDASIKLTIANKTFTVIGQAGTGVYNISRDRLTVFQALSMSGDINSEGDFGHVRIIRETPEGIKVLEFDIRPASIIDSRYYYVYPNDIIYVQMSPSSFYKVKNYGAFIGLLSSSLSLMVTVLYYLRN